MPTCVPTEGDSALANQNSLTQDLADFAVHTRYEDIPHEVMRLGKKHILDGLAAALSGSASDPVQIIRDYLNELACRHGNATVIGSALTLPPRFAALANGTAMHADDFDDTLQAETGRFQGIHPTTPVLCALLAAAEQKGCSGKELLLAYQVGVEATCRIFDATHVNHVLHGYHATGTCGMLGAAVAVAKLLHADMEQTRRALGIAASHTGALQANFGTMMKPYHAGRSAEGGIVANELALRGFTASLDALDGSRGFFMAEGGGCDEARLRGKLGRPWSFVERGICLKPFPTGGLSHPGMTKFLELVNLHDIKPEQVARLRVSTSENIHHTLLHHRPQTELQAKFSLEFCLAALLLDRKCGLTQFTDEYVNRPEIQRLIERIEYSMFSETEARTKGYEIVTTFIEIDLHGGTRHTGRADYGRGNIADPMSEDEVADKFRDCAVFCRWPARKTERAMELIRSLETLSDVRELTACLAAGANT